MRDEMTSEPGYSRSRYLWIVFCIFAVLTGVRVINIFSHSPEYDEIWTCEHYVGKPVMKILTDVATPNNHVLNSLGIKFFSGVIRDAVFAMRLPSLLAFAGLFLLLLRAVLKFFHEWTVRGMVLAAILLDGMILFYAETARGYMMQTFFLFGLLLSLLCFSDSCGRNRRFNAWMWLICALGCCLSVSSGVIFVTVLTGLWCLLHIPFRAGIAKIRQEYFPLIAAGFCWSVFVLSWYGGNFTRFSRGRAEFGESFASLMEFFRFFFNILWSSGLLWPVLILIAGAVWLRRGNGFRICLLTGGTVLLTLFSSVVSKGGPVRVYMPLIPIAVFGAGTVLDELVKRYEKIRRLAPAALLLILLTCGFFSESRRTAFAGPDLRMVFRNVKKEDSSVLVAYRPTDLYVLLNLFGNGLRQDHVNRLENPTKLLLLHDNQIGTMRFADSATDRVSPGCPPRKQYFADPIGKMPCWLYSLRALRSGEDLSGRALLCIIHGYVPELEPWNRDNWLKNRFATVNGFLMQGSFRFCLAADGTGMDADQLLSLEKERDGKLFFRVVE